MRAIARQQEETAAKRSAKRTAGLPYETTSTGKNALTEIEKALRAFGASSFGSMEDWDRDDLVVQFTWRGRNVSIRAFGKGYAALWLKRHPWTSRLRTTISDYEHRALAIGRIAVYSIVRDWIKGQVAAIETGILSFDAAFRGQIMLPSGETVMEHVEHRHLLALPPPTHRTGSVLSPSLCAIAIPVASATRAGTCIFYHRPM